MCEKQFTWLLPLALGEHARDFLSGEGYAVVWQDYAMAHQVCAEEIHAIGAWLARVLELS